MLIVDQAHRSSEDFPIVLEHTLYSNDVIIRAYFETLPTNEVGAMTSVSIEKQRGPVSLKLTT